MSIKQVSEGEGTSADTLRYYERTGLIPSVNRTKGGIRSYTEKNLKWVDLTICVGNAGLSIESLIEHVHLSSEGEATIFERRKLLIEESKLLTKETAEM